MSGPIQQPKHYPTATLDLDQLHEITQQIKLNGRCVYRIRGEEQGKNRDYWALLSPKEYNEFRQAHSRWRWECNKVSLDAMTAEAIKLVGDSVATRAKVSSSTFYKVANLNITSNEEIEKVGDLVKNNLKTIKECDRKGKEIVDALKEKITSQKQSYEKEKIQGIWGWIKWFVWSCFDSSPLLLERMRRVKYRHAEEYIEEVDEQLAVKAVINIQKFETCALGQKKTKNIENTKGIKKWLTQYHPDKFLLEENIQDLDKRKTAENHRTVVISLVKIWDDMTKIMNENSTQE